MRVELLLFPVTVLGVLAPATLFRRDHQLVLALALGAMVSLGALSLIAFARFLLLLPAGSARTVGLLAVLTALAGGVAVLIVLALTQRHAPSVPENNRPRVLAVVAGAALLALGLELALPHFGIANLYYDWWEHFDLASFYSLGGNLSRHYQDGYTVTSRTPVFNLLTSLALTAFGDRFSIFQLATAAFAWLWVLPAILLSRRFLRDRALALVAVLSISPLMLFATTYGWPKGLVAFFALFALERFVALREKQFHAGASEAVQFGLAAGLTLMTHEGFTGYLLPLFGLLLYACIRGRARYSALLLAGLTAALVALPWYAWAAAQYGLKGGLIGYPEPGYVSPLLWVLDHVVIVVSSVLPITAFFHAYGDSWLQQLLVAYLRTAVGLLGVVFLLRVLARSIRFRGVHAGGHGPLLAFALAGILSTTLLLNGWGNGWASAESVFIPAMVALLLIACSRAPLTRGMLIVACAECLTVLTLALAYMWSPAAAEEPNARLALIAHIHFLGQEMMPLGIGLLVVGAALSLYAAFGSLWEKEKEPRAEWHEAPLAS